MPALSNAKHEAFCQEYLIDFNGQKAAERAGYAAASARRQATRLLSTNDHIAGRLSELRAARAERVGITADEVLAELRLLALSNVDDFVVDDAGRVEIRASAEHGPDALRAVQSVKRKTRTESRKDGEETTTVDVEVKLWDKPAALRMAGQHLGMFVERHEHTVTEPIRVIDFSSASPPTPADTTDGDAD